MVADLAEKRHCLVAVHFDRVSFDLQLSDFLLKEQLVFGVLDRRLGKAFLEAELAVQSTAERRVDAVAVPAPLSVHNIMQPHLVCVPAVRALKLELLVAAFTHVFRQARIIFGPYPNRSQ